MPGLLVKEGVKEEAGPRFTRDFRRRELIIVTCPKDYLKAKTPHKDESHQEEEEEFEGIDYHYCQHYGQREEGRIHYIHSRRASLAFQSLHESQL
jgi:hypothetical protein